MGYTVYWQRPERLEKTLFSAAVEDCRKALAAIGVPFDHGGPIFSRNQIMFGGFETFTINQTEADWEGEGKVWEFCKTAHCQYDICVKACLIVFKHHFGDIFTTQGDGSVGEWDKAREAVQKALGYGGDFVPDPREEE